MITANKYKVPKSQWRKWCPLARMVFNEMFGTTSINQNLFVWGDDVPRTRRRWRVSCWNHAWLAADAVRDGLKHIASGKK